MKLFLLNTPRYLVYYLAMLEKKQEKGILIFTGNFLLIKEYHDALIELGHLNPFIEIIILSENYYKVKKNDYHKIKHRRFGFKKIHTLFDKYPIDTVITSNDGLLFSQYALSLNCNKKNIYLEDGLLNYDYENHHKKSLFSKLRSPLQHWFYKKVYFKEWVPTGGSGDGVHINETYASYPEHITERIKKPVNHLSKTNLMYQSLFNHYLFKRINASEGNLKNLDIIVLLGHRHEQLKYKNYQKEILLFCKKLEHKNIGIKKHPRDFENYDEINALDNTLFLPDIAMELLFPLLSKKVIILGGFSTVLMLANFLGIAAYLLVPEDIIKQNKQYRHFDVLFKKLEIKNIKSISKFDKVIRA